MTVMVDLTSLADNFSGVERFALSITKELIKYKDIEYILVFKNEVHKAFFKVEENVKAVVLKGKNKLLFNQILLPLYLLKIKADFYLFLAFPAPLLFWKKESITTIHDLGCWDCPKTNKKHMILYFRILYRKAAMNHKRLITVSKFSKGRIQNILHVKEDCICVVYNGVSKRFSTFIYNDKEYRRVEEKYNLPDSYILCLSTIEPRKNLGLLINAYCNLLLQYPVEMRNCNLVLAGRKGWMVEELLKDIPEYVCQHIHFTGFIEDEDLPYIYSGAELFVFPSLYEGFGIPPLEALACGTQVLSSDAASLPEILGQYAVYFENNNEDELLRKLYEIICKRKTIAFENRMEVVNKYNWETEAKKIINLFKMKRVL